MNDTYNDTYKEAIQNAIARLNSGDIGRTAGAVAILEAVLAAPEWNLMDSLDGGRDKVFIARVKQTVCADEHGLNDKYDFLGWREEDDVNVDRSEWMDAKSLPEPNCVVLAKVQLQAMCDSTDWGGKPYHVEHKILQWKPWGGVAGTSKRRPIGEAPMDGASVLLRNYGGRMYVGAYRVGITDEPQLDTAGWRTNCCGRFVDPVCWYELPEGGVS